jgi:hypothetical protein
VCLSPVNFWLTEPIFMKFCMYVIALEPISSAFFVKPCDQSVCIHLFPVVTRHRLCIHLPICIWQRLGKNFTAKRIHIGFVVFYSVRRLLVLPRTSCFFRNLWRWSASRLGPVAFFSLLQFSILLTAQFL